MINLLSGTEGNKRESTSKLNKQSSSHSKLIPFPSSFFFALIFVSLVCLFLFLFVFLGGGGAVKECTL